MNQQPKNVELSSPPKSAGHTNHQLTDPAASLPKSTGNAALVVTPDNRKSPIDVDDGDDSVALSSILLNDDNKEGGVAGDDVMDWSGLTIESSTVPKTGYNSTENDVATAGGALSVNISLTDDDTGLNDTGDEAMEGKNSEHNVVEDGAADFKSTNEVIDRIEKEIVDVQYLIDTTTGATRGTKPEDVLGKGFLKIANAQLLRLQRSLEEKKKTATSDIVIDENTGDVTGKPVAIPKATLGSHEIGGRDTINALAKQVLISNTTSNAVSSIRAGTINNTVTPVWKYSQHQQRLASIVFIPTLIWNKIRPLKTVRYIDRIPTTIKFKVLW